MPEQRPTEDNDSTDGRDLERDGGVQPSTPPGGERPDDDAPGNFVDDPDGDIPEPNEPA